MLQEASLADPQSAVTESEVIDSVKEFVNTQKSTINRRKSNMYQEFINS